MIYYHGSNVDYDFPSIEVIQSTAENGEKAAKVALGYYVTPWKDLAGRLGKYLYEIILKEDAVVCPLILTQMIRDYDQITRVPLPEQIAFYKNERLKYLEGGADLVSIIEHDGSSGESVVVNLNAIQSFRKVSL
jgi:hypothetical protein